MIQKINSQTLRQKFPKYYEDLFSKCQVVISSSNSFFWAGEYARFFGGLVIQQKLPDKSLVGIELTNDNKIAFAPNLFGYNPTKNRLEPTTFDPAKESRLLTFLNVYLPTIDPKFKINGFRIHILNESRSYSGLGTTGTLLACLAAGILLLTEKITPADIISWEKASVEDLLHQPQFVSFRQVFRLAWRLTAITSNGNSSGSSNFTALIKSPYPIIYMSQNIHEYLDHPTISAPQTILENCQIIEEIPFWGNRLEEIFDIKMPQPWPIDMARIFTGTLINTENIFKRLFKMRNELEELQLNIKNELAPKITEPKISLQSLFGYDANRVQTCTYMDYLSIFHIATLQLLISMKNLFTGNLDEDNFRQFTTSVHRLQEFNHYLGHSLPILDEICRRLTTLAQKENEFGIAGAKIEGLGKGGYVLLAAPSGNLTEEIFKETAKIARGHNKDVHVDWASWVDGFGEDGLIVEQFIEQKIYSQFIPAQAIRLTTYIKGNPEIQIVDHAHLEKLYPKLDLILSEPQHKVCINCHELSSKEIPSSKSTIKIIKHLLEAPDHKLTNKSISDDSYGQNRYDLQSKIFIPLAKALHNIAGKELEFNITGGMYDNYTVTLDPKKLTIGIIEEIE